MTGLGEKRKRSTGPKSSSPAKKAVISPKTRPTTSCSPSKKRDTRSRRRVAAEQTPPQRTITESPPKTPKSPSGAIKLGLNKGTAKSLLKHGSKITPLYNMLYGFAQMVMEKQPRSEDEFKPLLDQLAGQLVNIPLFEFPFLSFFLFSLPFQSLTLRILNCSRGRRFRQF